MTTPFDSESRTGDIDNADNASAEERTLDDGQVVKSEPVPVSNEDNQHSEHRDLGVKDVHASGQGCTCGHHKTCDCPPGECHCHGHAGEQGAHRNEGGVPDHGDCECQQCQERRRDENGETRDNGDEKDFTHPDTVNEDGTNPAVRTVDKAEGYNENASLSLIHI